MAAQNTRAASTQAPPATPASPAAKIGVFVNPKNGQSTQQQAEDENTCYSTAQQQTGIDPTAAAAPPPEAAKKQGGGAKGAAGGAAGGVALTFLAMLGRVPPSEPREVLFAGGVSNDASRRMRIGQQAIGEPAQVEPLFLEQAVQVVIHATSTLWAVAVLLRDVEIGAC